MVYIFVKEIRNSLQKNQKFKNPRKFLKIPQIQKIKKNQKIHKKTKNFKIILKPPIPNIQLKPPIPYIFTLSILSYSIYLLRKWRS